MINAAGDNVGVVSIEDAMQQAYDADMDLVEVAPQANPPALHLRVAEWPL